MPELFRRCRKKLSFVVKSQTRRFLFKILSLTSRSSLQSNSVWRKRKSSPTVVTFVALPKISAAAWSCSTPTSSRRSPRASRGCLTCPPTAWPWRKRPPTTALLPRRPRLLNRPTCGSRLWCSSSATPSASWCATPTRWRFAASSACPTGCPACRPKRPSRRCCRCRRAGAWAAFAGATRGAARRWATSSWPGPTRGSGGWSRGRVDRRNPWARSGVRGSPAVPSASLSLTFPRSRPSCCPEESWQCSSEDILKKRDTFHVSWGLIDWNRTVLAIRFYP